MTYLKRIGIVLIVLPVALMIFLIAFEVFGMCMNHAATSRQTEKLQDNLVREIPDIEIVSVYSETGNLSGTGNHVDCLSVIQFSTDMEEREIERAMSDYYSFDPAGCYVKEIEDGYYSFYLESSAPFPDNIEGH